jgi:hypothetical protein
MRPSSELGSEGGQQFERDEVQRSASRQHETFGQEFVYIST